MKFNKKFLSIFFIALLAVVLVACGGTTTAAPTTAAPTTAAPTTVAPTTQAPTTVAPTTAAPTTVAPTTEAPTTTETPVDWVTIEAALRAHYSETLDNDDFVATADLTLITTISDATIAWSSSNTLYLGHDGTVTQPAFATGDQTVILTATLTIGAQDHEVMFFVTIDALAKTDLERATEALATVMIFPFKEKWTEADSGSMVLLATAKDADNVEYAVVWTSSHPEFISTAGEITQPAEDAADVVVTLTATITIGTEEYSATKDFTVAKKVGATVVTSIADAIALGLNAYVEITGVTFIGKVTNGGYYFTDGTDLIYAYTNSLAVTIGAVYDLKGMVDEYYGYSQLNTGTDMPIMVTASTEPVSVFVPTVQTIAYIMENATASDGDMKIATAYTVTGRVYYAPDYTDPVYLVPSDYDFVNNFDPAAKPVGDALEIYDYSNDELLIPFHGQEVTIMLIPLGFHSTHVNHYAYFIGSASDIEVTIEDDATAVAAALDTLTYPTTIVADTTLDLPASLFGVTLTYASDNAAINATTGFVDAASQTTQVTVTLTVTANRGTVTDTKVFTIKVGELQVSTVAQAIASPINDLLKVQATIIGGGYSTYYIQDATGAMGLYVPSDLRPFFAANIGNVVEIVGNRADYNGLNQLSNITATFIEEGTLYAAVNINDATEFLPYQAHLIELVGMEVLSTSTDSNGNVTLSLKDLISGITFAARWDSHYTLSTDQETALKALVVGDIINIEAILGWYNNPQIAITAQTVITMTTDAEKLAMDAGLIPATKETTSGASETILLEGPYGSTIVWDMTTIVAAGGTFDPVTGAAVMPSVEVNTDYAVTATLSLGSETDVVVNVVVTVLAMTDAEKLAAAIAADGVDQDCDGYEVVVLPTTGLYGTTITWALVSGAATLDGATITFDQLAEVATVVLDATFVNGTASEVVQYTITVTPAPVITDLSTIPALADGTAVYVQGIITGVTYNSAFIQDANGVGFFLYKPTSHAELAIGDEVVYKGTIGSHGDAKQLVTGGLLLEELSTGNALIYNTVTADEIHVFAMADAGSLYTFAGFTYEGLSTDAKHMFLSYTLADGVTEGMVQISYYTDYQDLVAVAGNYTIGELLPEVNFIYYNYNYGYKQLSVVTVEFTDTEYIQFDANALPTSLTLTEDYVIPTPLYGSTYTVLTVTGDAAANIDYTTTPGILDITRPAVGSLDVVGSVTIQVTLGTEAPIDVVIPVTVKAEVEAGTITELFISEYGEGSASNKWIEIYNGTGADVDLSTYSVALYSNGSATATSTQTLTGTLAAGDVYVLYNSSSVQAIKDLGDLSSAVANFNGDDAIALLKNSVVIDVLGIIGQNGTDGAGGDWPDLTNHTVVRKSTITGPVTTWDPTEWDVYASDTFTYIGSHTVA